MLYKTLFKYVVFCLGGLLLLTGCYKNKTVIITTPEEITRPVTFSADMVPMFSTSCALSGCHAAGGQKPDLSAGSAYNSLINGSYVDTSSAENSLLYKKMSGKVGSAMPVSGINLSYNALVLAWIKQGAQNN